MTHPTPHPPTPPPHPLPPSLCSIFNARFDPRPAAVYYAHSTEEVSQAVLCAAAANVSISPAGGRQSFQGWNVPDGYLVVDVSNMTEVCG